MVPLATPGTSHPTIFIILTNVVFNDFQVISNKIFWAPMKALIQSLGLPNTAFNKFLVISNKNIGFLLQFYLVFTKECDIFSSIVIEGARTLFLFFKCILKKQKQKKQSYYLFKPILIPLHSKTQNSLQNYFSMTKFAFKR